MNFLVVATGGCIGAVARFFVVSICKKWISSLFPYATLFVNLVGTFLLGLLFGAGTEGMLRLLFGVGFLGAFTTFSTLQLDLVLLLQQKKYKPFLLYSIGTYGGGIVMVFLGFYFGTK